MEPLTDEIRRAVWQRDWRCRAWMLAPGPCEGPEQVHHLVKRSHGGPHDLDNLMLLCALHHRWVETHSVEAHALGLHRWSWERPA